ncbi:uncharacterized protein LOC126410236 [Nymphaea colorata]|uniref:uncharacterized protein LOC126410236 n=1 Tax=Nymphaea colorata TaxID=210225 RepID=UPI00214EA931|nr:uncharacterized protein LOC126410236 [Nymphaea colorata]XP_049934777.1 uncharacterized protein LOC126410236 [Nymphaea colorata]
MYEGGRSGITGRKRRGTTDVRARRGMRPPSGRVPTGRSSVGSIKSFFPSYTSPGGQPQIRAAMTSKDMLYHAQKQVGKWFYDACIPFNAANSFQFQAMADAIASIGPGFKMPSYHQLRGKILQDTVKEVSEHCDELKLCWKETGCSIMSDGWTDTRSRTLVNFLVYCPKGTMFLKSLDLSDVPKTAEILFNVFDNVVQEVGPANIVQFITDNAANYRAAGDLLFQKYRTFYWSPCATHCVNLMLQDLNEMHDMKSAIDQCQEVTKFIYNHAYVLSLMRKFTKGVELIRPAQTRFATNVLTVQSVVKQRTPLRQMFASEEWAAYPHAHKRNASLVVDIIFNNVFWESCVKLLKVCVPLVKVLRLADSEDRPSIGYLYEAMDKAKEAIRDNLKEKKKLYMPIWKIIDKRWTGQLHQPLHAAAYYLNPAIRFSPTFKKDREVMHGLLDCINVLVEDSTEQDAVHNELDLYDSCFRNMGLPAAVRARTTMRPDLWWNRYGFDCPNLARFAVKVLSQTCSASGCERNWSVFQHIHSKKRNRLEHKRLNDLVFVRYNMRLKQRELEKSLARKHTSQFDPISLENFDDLEPWIEEEPTTIFDDEDLECFNLEVEATEGFVDEGESATAGAGAEYVGEDLPILDDEEEEEDEDEDDEDYE